MTTASIEPSSAAPASQPNHEDSSGRRERDQAIRRIPARAHAGLVMDTPDTFQPTPRIREAQEAFARLEPEIEMLRSVEQPPPRVDVGRAVALVLGAHARILPHRRDMIRLCKATDIAALDRLRMIALAAWHAHLQVDVVREATRDLPALLDEARPLREELLRAAELLAFYGVFDPERTGAIRAGSGNIDTAEDLVQLATLFEEAWTEIEGRAPVTREMIERAGVLGVEILETIGIERGAPRGQRDVVQMRNAAFALLVDNYDVVRRAVTYLRWTEGDADALAPSLFTARRRPRRAEPSEGSRTEDTPVSTGTLDIPSPVTTEAGT